MIFKCKNCGANTVWSPEHDRMCCPHCDSIDSEELVTNKDMYASDVPDHDDLQGNGFEASPFQSQYQCLSCGAPIQPKRYDSAVKCEHCGVSTIFDERISGGYEPQLVIPFKISKQNAKDIIREQFNKKIFLPKSFLKEASLDKMEGDYIPFFLFDVKCHYRYSAKGKKVRVWRSGNTEYTETSLYQIYRTMDADFSRIPADASLAMPDHEMDLLEPFDYTSMYPFQPKFMSGYHGELYSVGVRELEPRARHRAEVDAHTLMRGSISGYSSITPECDDCRCQTVRDNYALLPVWNYTYHYRNKEYQFHVNGQTGKMVGKAPMSMLRMFACSGFVFGLITIMGFMFKAMMEVFPL